MRNVTIKQMRALDALIRAGSISAAARELNITPPAVSMQLRLLEEAAGLPLYERTNEGVLLSQAGLEVMAVIKGLEASLVSCNEGLTLLKGIDGGKVSVGVISTAKYFAPRILAAFADDHPDVEVRLSVGNRGATIAGLANYEFDFAVMGLPPQELQTEDVRIGGHPHIIIGPPDHPLAGRRRIRPSQLSEETFLLREAGSGTRILMQRLFEEMGVNPRSGMEIGSNETIKQAVMAGLGIALLSAHTVIPEISDGRLRIIPVFGFPVMRDWFVVRRQDRRFLPAAQTLWDSFASSGEGFLPDITDMIRAANRQAPRSHRRRAKG